MARSIISMVLHGVTALLCALDVFEGKILLRCSRVVIDGLSAKCLAEVVQPSGQLTPP